MKKTVFYDVGRKPNDGFRILFLNWIYDYSSYDSHEKMKILDQAGGYLTYWLIRKVVRDENQYDEFIKKRESGHKEFFEEERKPGRYSFSELIKSKTEERFVCFKC